ncbi:MAG TPA: hypothetical protein VMM76_06100 [Pirellulaceae bacterium]|nr:hypothetical protein [Pirellulaceae bacterium]
MLVAIMFVGFAVLVISYKWRKSQVKVPVVYEVPKEVIEQRDAEKRAVRWLVEREVRLKDHFREIDPDDFARQPHVSVVHVEFLSADQVTVESISRVKILSGLRTVSFYDTPIKDEHTALIAELTNVPELNLNFTEVTDAGLAKLALLPDLSILRLNGTHVTDEGLSLLRGSKLHTLSLFDTAVTDNGLAELGKLPQLLMLDVQKTGVTPEGVSRFRESRARCFIYSDPY